MIVDLKGWRQVGSMDVGQKRDWTTAGVWGFPEEEPTDGTIWQTCILALHKLRSRILPSGEPETPLLDVVEQMCRDVFDHFPDMEVIITDATRDMAIADWLGRRYGEGRVIPFIFSPKSHVKAWHSTLYYFNDARGYPWPRVAPGTTMATHVAELQEQMTIEEVRLNDRGQYIFRHPGAHNDWLHMTEMAHDAIRDIQIGSPSGDPAICGNAAPPPWIQSHVTRPPFLARLDQKAGRKWGGTSRW